MNYYISLLIFFLFCHQAFSQFSAGEQRQIDSLTKVVKNKSSHDTSVANAYVNLSEIYYVSNQDTLIYLCSKAEEIAKRNLKKEITQAERKAYEKALAIALNNLGIVYDHKGNMPEALQNYHDALTIQEKIGDKVNMATTINNIGSIHLKQDDYKRALNFYLQSLKIRKAIKGSEQGIASVLNNIGATYDRQGDIQNSRKYFQQSLELVKELGYKNGIAFNLNNIANTYYKEAKELQKQNAKPETINAKLDSSLLFHNEALKYRSEIGDKRGISNSYKNIGDIYFLLNDLPKAKYFSELSYQVATETQTPDAIRESSKLLSDIYKKEGHYFKSLEMYELYITMRDSLKNKETEKTAAKLHYKYEYEKKAAADSIRTLEERKLVAAKLEKEQSQRYNLYAGLALVICFSGFIFNRLRITRNQKKIIEDQKKLVDDKNIQIEHAKQIIEIRHKEVTDSIHYAKRIQQALLTSPLYIKSYLRDHFVIFKPKDIVSGDFYWGLYANDRFYMAVCDCTGHGVPGAFMSLLNISFLNETIIEKRIYSPENVLNEIRKDVIAALNTGSGNESQDGMDAVVCSFDVKRNRVEFAAANNPLWLIRNGELIEFKGDKMPVGKYLDEVKPFTLQSLDLQKNDLLYLFTDGFADQFGGEQGKKFKYSKFKELLLSIKDQPMIQQKQLIEEAFSQWKASYDQVDDVCVVGIRI